MGPTSLSALPTLASRSYRSSSIFSMRAFSFLQVSWSDEDMESLLSDVNGKPTLEQTLNISTESKEVIGVTVEKKQGLSPKGQLWDSSPQLDTFWLWIKTFETLTATKKILGCIVSHHEGSLVSAQIWWWTFLSHVGLLSYNKIFLFLFKPGCCNLQNQTLKER